MFSEDDALKERQLIDDLEGYVERGNLERLRRRVEGDICGEPPQIGEAFKRLGETLRGALERIRNTR